MKANVPSAISPLIKAAAIYVIGLTATTSYTLMEQTEGWGAYAYLSRSAFVLGQSLAYIAAAFVAFYVLAIAFVASSSRALARQCMYLAIAAAGVVVGIDFFYAQVIHGIVNGAASAGNDALFVMFLSAVLATPAVAIFKPDPWGLNRTNASPGV